jgi:ketosteroid isomerase-like protein
MSTPLTTPGSSEAGVRPLDYPGKDASALSSDAGKGLGLKTFPAPQQAPYWKCKDKVIEYIREVMNNSRRKDVLQVVDRLCEGNATTEFWGSSKPPMSQAEFVGLIGGVVAASFPDFKLQLLETTYRERPGENGCIISEFDLLATGHLTGVPYIIPPGSENPAIQPTGASMKMPLEPVRCTFSPNLKMLRIEAVQPYGAPTAGPLLAYLNVGGKLLGPQTRHVGIARRFAALHRPGDISREIADLFAPDATMEFGFTDAKLSPLDLQGLVGSVIFQSFPDFKLQLLEDTYKELDNTLSIEGQVTMTHTGAPFAFPPDAPALKATGKKVVVPRERMDITLNAQGKIRKVYVSCPSGEVGGPLAVYLQLGGKLSVRDRNLVILKRAYAAFKRGDIPHIIDMMHPNVDLCWGEDDGLRRLPWYGRWVGHQGVGQAFQQLDKSTEFLKFEVKEMLADKDVVIGIVGVVIRSKETGKMTAATIAHRFQFDENGKVVQFKEMADTGYVAQIYLP